MLLHLSVILFTGRGMHGRGCAQQGGMCSRGEACMVGAMRGGGMHAGEMVTEAGGRHPTGKHSCFNVIFLNRGCSKNLHRHFCRIANSSFRKAS